MHIEIGKYYENKTWKYLLPCLRGHGNVFVSKYNPVFKLAVGVHDTIADGSEKLEKDRTIFIMCDKRHQTRKFHEFLDWLSYQPYYRGNYCPDADMSSRRHIIVITVPETFNGTYDMFLKGKYSKMYTKQQIDFLFSNPARAKEKAILLRDKSVAQEFLAKLRDEFNVIPDTTNMADCELDLPLKRCEEIFNCEDNQRVFFNEELDKVWQD